MRTLKPWLLNLFDLFALGGSWDTKTSACACSCPLICLVLRDGGGTKTLFLQAHSLALLEGWWGLLTLPPACALHACSHPSCLLTPVVPACTLLTCLCILPFCSNPWLVPAHTLYTQIQASQWEGHRQVQRVPAKQTSRQTDTCAHFHPQVLFASTHALALLTPTCPRLRPLAPEPVELVKLSLPNIGTVSRNLRIVIFTLVALKFIW